MYLRPWKRRGHSIKDYVNRLPFEILGEIFAYYLTLRSDSLVGFEEKDNFVSSSLTSIANPFILSHVCRCWRKVALHTPSLWTTIAVHKPKRNDVAIVRIWLQRALGRPMTIALLQTIEAEQEEIVACTKIMSLFVERSSTWKSIDLMLSSGAAQKVLSRLPDGSYHYPHLQRASLKFFSHDHGSDSRMEQHILRKLYSSVSLTQCNWCPGLTNQTSFSQLKYIQVQEHITVQDFFDIVLYAFSLEALEINKPIVTLNPKTHPAPILPLSPIVHDNLRFLSMTLCPLLEVIFQKLTLSALEILLLSPRFEPLIQAGSVKDSMVPSLDQFFARSSGSSRNMNINLLPVGVYDLPSEVKWFKVFVNFEIQRLLFRTFRPPSIPARVQWVLLYLQKLIHYRLPKTLDYVTELIRAENVQVMDNELGSLAVPSTGNIERHPHLSLIRIYANDALVLKNDKFLMDVVVNSLIERQFRSVFVPWY